MMYPIDINKYMNHKMIFHDDEFGKCNELLDEVGLCSDPKRHWGKKSCFEGRYFTCFGVEFMSPPICCDNYDNTSCNGQKIEIKKGLYHAIHYIGYCDIGRFRESVLLQNQNMTIGESTIFFYDWGIKGNTVRSYDIKDDSCKIALVDEKDYENDYLFMYSAKIDAKEFDTLLLPHNPFVHIIAITIEG